MPQFSSKRARRRREDEAVAQATVEPCAAAGHAESAPSRDRHGCGVEGFHARRASDARLLDGAVGAHPQLDVHHTLPTLATCAGRIPKACMELRGRGRVGKQSACCPTLPGTRALAVIRSGTPPHRLPVKSTLASPVPLALRQELSYSSCRSAKGKSFERSYSFIITRF